MNTRRTIVALLVCLLATAAAVRAVDDLSAWVVDQMGTEGRAALQLSTAPWFEAQNAPGTPAPLPGTAKPQDRRAR